MAAKIPLHIRGLFGEEGIFLNFTIRGIPHANIIPVNALVDTGSPWLSISPKDCRLLNIPQNFLENAREFASISFAGQKFRRLVAKEVKIHVLAENNTILEFAMPSISVLKPTKKSAETDLIPSVVGMDFMTKNGLALYCNPRKKEAYLIKEN